MSYPARHHPVDASRHAPRGALHVDDHGLRFVPTPAATDEIRIPWPALRVRFGGFDNRTAFFALPPESELGGEISCQDPKLFADPRLLESPAFAEARTAAQAPANRFWGCVAMIALVLFVFFTLGWFALRTVLPDLLDWLARVL